MYKYNWGKLTMNEEKRKVSVIIDGNTYTLITGDSPDKIKKIVNYVNKKTSEISNASSVVDSRNAAVLTCINIADDYFKSVEDADNLRVQAAKYIKYYEKSQNEIKKLKEEIKNLKKDK